MGELLQKHLQKQSNNYLKVNFSKLKLKTFLCSVDFFQYIQTSMEFYNINEGQTKEISQSREDYANGLVIDHQTVNEKVEKWAKEK